jgi:hypothetical protein
MYMNIEIEGTPEALNDRHRAEAAARDAAPARARPQPPAHRAQVYDDDRPAQRVVPRDEIAQPRRQREDPLADRDGGKHAIDEMGGAVRPASAMAPARLVEAVLGRGHTAHGPSMDVHGAWQITGGHDGSRIMRIGYTY